LTETIEEAENMIDTKETMPILGKPEDLNPKNELLGGVLAFLSGLLFTASSVILQQLSINYSDAMFVRYSLQVITLLTIMTCINMRERHEGREAGKGNSGNYLQKSTVPLIFQGLCNGICVLGEFMCVSFMPIGDATAIIFSSPLPSMVLSTIFLGHSLRLYKIGCGLLLYLGVLFVVKPPFLFRGFKDFGNR
jgi:drug/metabolite transporter (DMT)-like permease